MSQKTYVVSMKHSGSPVYVGNVSGHDSYTCNPYSIAEWLCHGYRTRFNQHRSTRATYDSNGELIPIGKNVVDITDKEARRRYSYLSAMPSMIIQAAERKENTEWFSSVKRRKTSGGSMPRFKSSKLWDMQFVCWKRGTQFHVTGKRTGVLVISGQNPQGKVKEGHTSKRWKLSIRVKTTRDILDYTSVVVNITRNTVTFVNSPRPIARHEHSHGSVVGCDRGGAVAIATSNGEKLSPDKTKLSEWEKRKKFHQQKMGKARSRAKNSSGKHAMYQVMKGRKYQHHKQEAAKYSEKITRYKNAWAQEVTTQLVQDNDVIVLEDLHVSSMTRKGGRGKARMNHSFLSSLPSTIATMLEQKCLRSTARCVYIPPRYTSQRCSECGYTGKENRESQAVFLCRKCGHTNNADINAAQNIKELYQFLVEGTDLPAYDSMNGSGEIVKPTIPKGMIDQFYYGSLNDTINLQLLP